MGAITSSTSAEARSAPFTNPHAFLAHKKHFRWSNRRGKKPPKTLTVPSVLPRSVVIGNRRRLKNRLRLLELEVRHHPQRDERRTRVSRSCRAFGGGGLEASITGR